MEIKDVITTILDRQKVKMITLATRIGESRQAIWNKLKGSQSRTVSIPSAVRMLNALDYKLIAMPITKHTPEDCFEITDKGE